MNQLIHSVKFVQKRSFPDPHFSVFSPNTGNTEQKKLRIWTLFTQ